MTRLLYNVEIKCYPSSYIKIEEYINRFPERLVTNEISHRLFIWGIKLIDILGVPKLINLKSDQYIALSVKGRSISKKSWNELIDIQLRKDIEEDLTNRCYFLQGNISLSIEFRKISILTYYKISLKHNILIPLKNLVFYLTKQD